MYIELVAKGDISNPHSRYIDFAAGKNIELQSNISTKGKYGNGVLVGNTVA